MAKDSNKRKKEKRDKSPTKKSKKHKKQKQSDEPELPIAIPEPQPSPIKTATNTESKPEVNIEELRELLDPYSKEQLIDIICNSSRKNPDISSVIGEEADRDISRRKIFVRGLGWDATREIVSSVFEPYGELEDCTVVIDRETGNAKGYGFVVYKRSKDAKAALKDPRKQIFNRMATCNLACHKPMPSSKPHDSTNIAVEIEQGGQGQGGHGLGQGGQWQGQGAIPPAQDAGFYGGQLPPGLHPSVYESLYNRMLLGALNLNQGILGSGMMNQCLMPPAQIGPLGGVFGAGQSVLSSYGLGQGLPQQFYPNGQIGAGLGQGTFGSFSGHSPYSGSLHPSSERKRESDEGN